MTMTRTPLEPKDALPITPGLCDWCGGPIGKGICYCSAECRSSYRNLLARQGKSVMQLLKVWRINRGAKGSRGEGLIGEITNRLDQINAEDRERKARLSKNDR